MVCLVYLFRFCVFMWSASSSAGDCMGTGFKSFFYHNMILNITRGNFTRIWFAT